MTPNDKKVITITIGIILIFTIVFAIKTNLEPAEMKAQEIEEFIIEPIDKEQLPIKPVMLVECGEDEEIDEEEIIYYDTTPSYTPPSDMPSEGLTKTGRS